MIGNLEAAEHKDLGPVLIATFMPANQLQGVTAIVYTTTGLVKQVPIEELSILWHYDPTAGWEPDFPVAKEDT